MSSTAIYAQGAKIKASNTILSNCGEYLTMLSIGGDYQFIHCTMYNSYNSSERVTPSVWLQNYYIDIYGNTQLRGLSAYFGNTIIYGNIDNELMFVKNENTKFNVKFENCLVKQNNYSSFSEYFTNCIYNIEPMLNAPDRMDYSLLSGSPAIDNGLLSLGKYYPIDRNGNSRILDNKPDIGALEYKVK